MITRITIAVIMILGTCGSGHGQYYDKTYSIALDINAPLSNTDYVSQISARGLRIGYREMINDHFFAGFDFNNSSYTKYKARRTYSSATGAVTTDLFNYTYNYGITLSGEYYFKVEQRFMPYAGIGLGASYIKYKQFFNVYSNQSDSWGVLVRPQAGVQIRLKDESKWAFQAALHYDYSSAKNKDFELGSFSSIGINVGIIMLSW